MSYHVQPYPFASVERDRNTPRIGLRNEDWKVGVRSYITKHVWVRLIV